MPQDVLSALVDRAARAVQPAPAATDGGLLARFVRTRDDRAFAELVRRLGPMVLGACRRVGRDEHLADDAFQAAFIVLARRAADVRPPEAVRGWLYGVAVRTAHEARAVAARRRAREIPVADVPDRPAAPAEAPDADALRALDEELAALPDHLRAAVVLCELDGLSRKVAAEQLGILEGTLSSRLAKARKLLAARLKRRGVVVPAAGLTVLAHATVSPRLLAQTSAFATSGTAVPATVTVLTQGVFRTMFLQRLTVAAVAAAVLAACALAANPGPPPEPAAPPAQPPAPAHEKRAAPKPAGPGTLLLARGSGLVTLTPDGKEGDEHTAPKGTHTNYDGRLSPDGKRAAFLVTEDGPPRTEAPDAWPFKLVVRTAGAKDPVVVDVPAIEATLSWTADSARVVVTKRSGNKLHEGVENVLVDPATGKTEALALPENAWVLDCGRDGKTFLVAQWDGKKGRIGLAAKGDKEVRALAELKGWTGRHSGRLSPDGTRVLYTDADPEQKDANKWGSSSKPYLLDVATKKREELADFPENAQCLGVAWSPDGKRVAYTWKQLHADFLKKDTVSGEDAQIETEAFLVIADASGKNPKTVATGKLENAVNMIFGSIDWR